MSDDTAPAPQPANPDEQTFSLAISNGALFSLRNMLRAPGWAKGVKLNRKALKLSKILPKLTAPTVAADAEAWSEVKADPIAIPVRFRSVGADCLRAFAETGQLAPNETTDELFTAFEVTE